MNPEMSYAHNAGDAGPEPTPNGFFSRLMGVYFSPTETFQEIGRAPRVLIPMIATAIMMLVITGVMVTKIPVEVFMKPQNQKIDEAVAKGTMTEDAAARQRAGMKQFEPYMKYVVPATGTIVPFVIFLIIAGIAKLLSMMVGAENTFKQVFSMTLFVMLAVTIVSSILFLILLLIKPGDEIDLQNPISTNLAALLPALGVAALPKFMATFLAYIDVFTIWKVILFGIGLAAVSKKLKASTAVIGTAAVVFVIAILHSGWASMFG